MSIVYARTAEWGLSAIDSASLGAGSEKERTESSFKDMREELVVFLHELVET